MKVEPDLDWFNLSRNTFNPDPDWFSNTPEGPQPELPKNRGQKILGKADRRATLIAIENHRKNFPNSAKFQRPSYHSISHHPQFSASLILKPNMKKAPALLLALLSFSTTIEAATTSLAPLGNENFAIDVFASTMGFNQSTTNLTLPNTISTGDTLGGAFSTAYNWSAYSDTNNFSFGLLMSAPGVSPNLAFAIDFYSGDFTSIVNTYTGTASNLSTTPTFVAVGLSIPGTGDFSSIGGMQFTWDGSGLGTVTLESVAVAAVPEPASILLGGLGFLPLLRRRRTA